MNQNNNLLSFVLGAAIGGAAAYYLFKHQDEILDKIHDLEGNLNINHNEWIEKGKGQLEKLTQSFQALEGNLNIDHNEWIEKAKGQLEKLTQSFQATVERYTHGNTDEAAKENEIAHIVEELNKLRQEVKALSAN